MVPCLQEYTYTHGSMLTRVYLHTWFHAYKSILTHMVPCLHEYTYTQGSILSAAAMSTLSSIPVNNCLCSLYLLASGQPEAL